MNLIQSICCFFSSRCASGAPKPKTADPDDQIDTRDANTQLPMNGEAVSNGLRKLSP